MDKAYIDFDNAALSLSRRETVKGKPWRATLSYKAIEGYDEYGEPVYKWHQKNKTFRAEDYGTKRSATIAANKWVQSLREQQEAALQRVQERKRKEEEERKEAATPHLHAYLHEFVANYRGKNGKLEDSTRADYLNTAKLICKTLEDRRMSDLAPKDVDAWLNGLAAEGRSASAQRKAYVLLNQAYKNAIRDGATERNPLDAVSKPRTEGAKLNPLTSTSREQLLNLLASCRPTAMRTAAYIALYTGLRVGEIAALQWVDVDFKAGELNVHAALGRGEGGTYRKEPKTATSVRRLPIPEDLVQPLHGRKNAMQQDIAACGLRLSPDAFGQLFVCGTIEGAWKSPNAITKEWHVIAENFGLYGTKNNLCTFHDLRHTWATMAVKSGADVKSVQSYLGHASAAMTLDIYADADENAKRHTAEQVNAAMREKSDPAPEFAVIKRA